MSFIDLEQYICSNCKYSKRIEAPEPNRECTFPSYSQKAKGKRFYAGWHLKAVLHTLGLREEFMLMSHSAKRLCYSPRDNTQNMKGVALNLIWGKPIRSKF